MIAYSRWIAKNGFGVEPDSNEYYSFVGNAINGHFFFRINPQYYEYNRTPQSENEVMSLLNDLINKFKSDLNKNEQGLPDDFPNLFNSRFLKLYSLSPNYNFDNDFIISWSALYGIELETYNNKPVDDSKKVVGVLESDSVIVEISGERIVTMNYNHIPITHVKSTPVTAGDDTGVIYKKVNLNTIAPYFLTPEGYIPACKDSIPINSKPVGFGWNNSVQKSDNPQGCKSRITMSNIVQPIVNISPGTAKIVISMDYIMITTGEGQVFEPHKFEPLKFSQLFQMGNMPGGKEDNFLPLKVLPQKYNDIDPNNSFSFPDPVYYKILRGQDTEKNYYNTTIEYQFKLDNKLNFTLWEGLKWYAECISSRGLILTVPFFEDVIDWFKRDNLSINQYEKNLLKTNPQLSNSYTIKELQLMYDNYKDHNKSLLKQKMNVYILKCFLEENRSKYSNKNLYIKGSYDGIIPPNNELSNYLNTISSNITSDDANLKLDINPFYFSIGFTIIELIISNYDRFERAISDPVSSILEVYACASNTGINIILLSPYFFHDNSDRRTFFLTSLTRTEILVHEAGHNLSKSHTHTPDKSGKYEYTQEGLQSNQSGKIYPTRLNTISILEDSHNRDSMTIK